MSKHKILLIENQIIQYREIRTKLSLDFHVFPEENDFIEFTDHVRILLTKRYDNAYNSPGERRIVAINWVLDYIKDKGIDVILMDHILVGHHSGENGIHLAKKFIDNHINIPIIFLSRSHINDQKVQETLNNVDIVDPIWVEKGYAGQGIGDDWYFKRNIIGKIKYIIGHPLNQIIDDLISLRSLSEFHEALQKLRDVEINSQQLKELREFRSGNPLLKDASILKNILIACKAIEN